MGEELDIRGIVQLMSRAKQGLAKRITELPQTPAVVQAARLCVEHLDTSYLWLTQVDFFAKQASPENVDAVVAEAAAEGKVTVFPGTAEATAPDGK